MIPLGVEPATFWLVAQCLSQLQHRVLHSVVQIPVLKFWYFVEFAMRLLQKTREDNH